MSTFLHNEDGITSPDIENPSAFIQWKGTNVCMDFYCECGAHCHFDGYFAYVVKCPHCETEWEMPSHVAPRKRCAGTYPGHKAQVMEPDEEMEEPQ